MLRRNFKQYFHKVHWKLCNKPFVLNFTIATSSIATESSFKAVESHLVRVFIHRDKFSFLRLVVCSYSGSTIPFIVFMTPEVCGQSCKLARIFRMRRTNFLHVFHLLFSFISGKLSTTIIPEQRVGETRFEHVYELLLNIFVLKEFGIAKAC